MTTYVSAVHNSSLAGGTDILNFWIRIPRCPEWDSNPHFTVFETARSTGWRIGAQLAHQGSGTITIYLVTVRSGA